MTEQPQEYIITMARIIKARNMLMADGYHNADVLDRMVNLLRSRPAPLTQNDGGDCLVICQHCGKVTQVQCKKDGD